MGLVVLWFVTLTLLPTERDRMLATEDGTLGKILNQLKKKKGRTAVVVTVQTRSDTQVLAGYVKCT